MANENIKLLEEQIIQLKRQVAKLELGFRHQDTILQELLISNTKQNKVSEIKQKVPNLVN